MNDTFFFSFLFRDNPTFDLDIVELESKYKALQRRLHPDRFSTAPEQQKEYSLEQASIVNQAYEVLKRPLQRATYLVRLCPFRVFKGFHFYDACFHHLCNNILPILLSTLQLSKHGMGACEGLTITDPDLLETVMDARETVEATNDVKELHFLKQRIEGKEKKCISDLKIAFEKKDLKKAAESVTVLRYFEKIREAIIEKL